MENVQKAKFLYFKESGKWYADGEGYTPATNEIWSREQLLAVNQNHMPGLSKTGSNFTVIVIPHDDAEFGWPQLKKIEDFE